MGEKNKIAKRKDAYRAAIKKTKEDRELNDAFKKLNTAIPQRKKKSPLTDDELDKMNRAY